ncbi:carbohydrate binding domain-containing protein [Actinomadura fibrosa]|uniref:Carbohydrate binding domain-containing protein n=1 Tax=Actinomadura fibrosa TaxID=111802 RepID=A0ABW2XCD5_9ACTN|nr:carbohydrate binding domain-containing protein [Actinomadura fibrosa]
MTLAVLVAAGTVSGTGAAAMADQAPSEMLSNGTFDTGSNPWYGNDADISVTDGELEASVPSGGFGELPGGVVNPWDRSVVYPGLSFTGYQLYKLSFDARATRDVTIDASVYTYEGLYIPYWEHPIELGTSTRHFEVPVAVYATASDRRLGFQLGTDGPSYRMYLDNVSLTPVQDD